VSLVRSFGRHSFEVGALLNIALEDNGLVQNFYPLGGFLRLSGLARGEISGPNAGVARLVYYRRSGKAGGGLFDIPVYLGASLEAGNVWQSRSDIDLGSTIANGSLFLGLDTFFGPVYLAAGLAEGGRSNFYLSVGTVP
jgi:NTE family protein